MGLAVLAACSTVPTLPPAPMEPEASTFTANLPPYRIQVGDVLEVRLLLNPELNEEVTVRPDGHISTTAIPDALAYGLTPADLADQLRRGYSRDLQIHGIHRGQVVRSDAGLRWRRSEHPGRIHHGGTILVLVAGIVACRRHQAQQR